MDAVRFRRRATALASVPIVLGALMVVQERTGVFQKGRPGGIGLVRAGRDPTADMVGWDVIAAELKRRGLLDQPGTFLFTSSWYHSGQLAFAIRGSQTPVLCYQAWDARSFAFWSRPKDWVGRDGILVACNDRSSEPDCFDPWFTRIEPIGNFSVDRAGVPVRTVRLFRCSRQTAPFPFDDLGRTIRPRGKSSDFAEIRRIAADAEAKDSPVR